VRDWVFGHWLHSCTLCNSYHLLYCCSPYSASRYWVDRLTVCNLVVYCNTPSVKVKEAYSYSKCAHSHVWHLLTRLSLLPSRRASPRFGWYSFPAPLRIGGWVGLGGLVKYWGGFIGLPAWRRSPIPVFVAAVVELRVQRPNRALDYTQPRVQVHLTRTYVHVGTVHLIGYRKLQSACAWSRV